MSSAPPSVATSHRYDSSVSGPLHSARAKRRGRRAARRGMAIALAFAPVRGGPSFRFLAISALGFGQPGGTASRRFAMRLGLRERLSVFGFAMLVGVPDALACGGTFCDSPPPGRPPMPVEQTGENILFVMTEGYVEAHVQIQYNGDPARFAWLVPVPAVPDLSVGSDQLFINLRNGSVPTFTVSNSFDNCGGSGRTSTGGCGFGSSNSEDATASFNGAGTDMTPKTQSDIVAREESVGAFDVTVLQATSAADVTTWLDTNGFLNVP